MRCVASKGVCVLFLLPERPRCQDFERGRGHLIFQLTLKLACFLEPPLLLLGVADQHPQRCARAKLALKRCLESSCQHHQIKRLQSQELAAAARLYLEGEDLRLLPELQSFLAELRFGFGSERAVEGGHAKVNMINVGRRNRTEASDSLALRMAEIEETISSTNVTSLLECLQMARNPRALVDALGLSKHPSLCPTEIKSAWDPIFRLVVYHADQLSMYSRQGRPFLRQQTVEEALPRSQGEFEWGVNAPESQALLCRAALRHLRQQLAEECAESESGGNRWLFSCKIPEGALNVLVELLAPVSVEGVNTNFLEASQEATPANLLQEARAGPSVFFQIVSMRPSRAHLGGSTALEASDIGIQVLKCRGVVDIDNTRHVRVETTNVCSKHVLQDALEMARQPLVLSLSALDLPQLESFVAWPEAERVQQGIDGAVETLLSRVGHKRLLSVRDGLENKDKSHWELMQDMVAKEWQCIVLRDKAARQAEEFPQPWASGVAQATKQ